MSIGDRIPQLLFPGIKWVSGDTTVSYWIFIMKKGKKTKLQPWYIQPNPSTPNPHKNEYLSVGWQKIWDLQPSSQHLFMSLSRRRRLCCLTIVFCFHKPVQKATALSLPLPAPPSCLGCSQVKSESSFPDPRLIITMLQEFPIQQSDIPGTHTAGITTGQRLFSSCYTESCQQIETSPISFISVLLCTKKSPFHLNLGLFFTT